jgi:hypothetical protein
VDREVQVGRHKRKCQMSTALCGLPWGFPET